MRLCSVALTSGRPPPRTAVFEAPDGGPLRYSNWRRRIWLPATQAAANEGAGFHDLRRASATALVTGGVDVRTAQTRLGHSDPRVTLSIYAQAVEVSDRKAAEIAVAAFLGQTDPVARDKRAMNAATNTGQPA